MGVFVYVTLKPYGFDKMLYNFQQKNAVRSAFLATADWASYYRSTDLLCIMTQPINNNIRYCSALRRNLKWRKVAKWEMSICQQFTTLFFLRIERKKTSYLHASASRGRSVYAAIEFSRRRRDIARYRSIRSHLFLPVYFCTQ